MKKCRENPAELSLAHDAVTIHIIVGAPARKLNRRARRVRTSTDLHFDQLALRVRIDPFPAKPTTVNVSRSGLMRILAVLVTVLRGGRHHRR